MAGRLRRKLAEVGDPFLPGRVLLDRFYPGVALGEACERRGETQSP